MGKKTIAIVNYGMGNIGSVSNALTLLGVDHRISGDREELAGADAFILPGVGGFGPAMENLRRQDLVRTLGTEVVKEGKPFLGICLGMQLVALDSVERGSFTGLGWMEGHVERLTPSGGLPVPHVGWNTVSFSGDSPLFRRIDRGSHFYFDHSYHLACDGRYVDATFGYGGTWTAAIRTGNIYATQFHPEKSQRNGLKILRNFQRIVNGT